VAGYRHYKNFGDGEQFVFFTTTVLDFERIFSKARLAGIMSGSLLDDCKFYGAALFAFVVMPHHGHFICRAAKGSRYIVVYESRKVEQCKAAVAAS
jgi:hypothetical protein